MYFNRCVCHITTQSHICKIIIMILWIKHMLVWQPYYIFDSWLRFYFIAKGELWKNEEKRGNSSRCFGTCSNHETCMHLNWSVQGRLRYSHNTIKIYCMSHRYWDNLANCLHTMIFLRIRIFYRKKTKYEVFFVSCTREPVFINEYG